LFSYFRAAAHIFKNGGKQAPDGDPQTSGRPRRRLRAAKSGKRRRRAGGKSMDETKTKKNGPHSVYIESRNRMVVTDVADVDTFTEETILLTIDKGGLVIKGQNLHIQRLDLEEGKVVITGFVQSAVYTEKKDKQSKSLLGRLLK